MNIIRKIFHKLVDLSLRDRVNIVKTLVVNFSFLPFQDALKFPIIIYGPCKLGSLSGEFVFQQPIKRGLLKIGISDHVRSLFSKSYVAIYGSVKVEGVSVLRRGINLLVKEGAVLSLGSSTFVADNCTIVSSSEVYIGSGTRVGNNTVIMDTDFHYTININSGVVKPAYKPISIGDNNWIGGWCTIKKGAVTPKGTILAGPYSMISKDYTTIIDEYSIIAGSPAKLLASGIRRVNNRESEVILSRHFRQNNSEYVLEDISELDIFCSPK